jgi:hypothetical protein
MHEGVRDVTRDSNGIAHRKRALAGEPLAQSVALEERHGEVEHPVRLPGTAHGDDVRVTHLLEHLHFEQEVL